MNYNANHSYKDSEYTRYSKIDSSQGVLVVDLSAVPMGWAISHAFCETDKVASGFIGASSGGWKMFADRVYTTRKSAEKALATRGWVKQ